LWRTPDPLALPADFLPDYPSLTRELVWRRGYRTDSAAHLFLYPLEFHLPPPGAYPCLAAAAQRINRAINGRQRVFIWGDFDADGQTATALLVGGLRRAGADVDFYIPDRTTDSHGLHGPGIERLAAAGCALLVTCDCGTNDSTMVQQAQALGMDVVITDHHRQTGPIPAAVALCNSSLVASGDPIAGIPGVAVAYLVLREVFAQRGHPGDESVELDLVALGIVADVVGVSPIIRAFLVRGLPLLWRALRPGISALLDLVGPPASSQDTSTISYKLAPMLNAAGRLADARLGVDLLLAADQGEAVECAARLRDLNIRRQQLTTVLEAEVERQIQAQLADNCVLIATGDGWHMGLIGVAASRVAARYGRPAVVMSRIPGQSRARGSVRAGGPHDVLAALEVQAATLESWGGHQHAAGFCLEADQIETFSDAFKRAVAEQGGGEHQEALAVEADVPWSSLTEPDDGAPSVLDQVLRLAPYCAGNGEPILMSRNLRLVSRRPFGRNDAYADLVFSDDSGVARSITCWEHPAEWRGGERYDVAYTLTLDSWRGRVRPRLTLVSARPAEELGIVGTVRGGPLA
jgi:single-stranded-DNA-specific exonuclease